MSSASSDPINNFESNAATFRPSSGRRTGDAPRPEMKRRVMDVQDVLAWAYREELPKDRGLGGNGGEPCAVSPMFAMGAFGTRVDYYHREPGFPSAIGPPHPDALLVEAAVERLAAFADQEIDEIPLLLPDFGEFGVDERQSVRRALGMVVGLVVKCAKLDQSPFWSTSTSPGPLYSGNGRPMVVRLEPIFSKTLTGEEVEHETLVPVTAEHKNSYPFGAYSPLEYDPSPQSIADERAEHLVWWGALAGIASELEGKLSTIAVLSPGAAQRPWIDRRALGKPPRLFQDLRSGVHRREEREIAAAHRMLGLRRSSGARGPAVKRGVPVRRARPTAVPEKACAAV